MTTCREFFTFSWPLRGRGGRPKRSAWPLFHSFFWTLLLLCNANVKSYNFGVVKDVLRKFFFRGKLRLPVWTRNCFTEFAAALRHKFCQTTREIILEIASLDLYHLYQLFRCVSKVSKWVILSNLRHLSLYTKDTGSCHHAIMLTTDNFLHLLSIRWEDMAI